MRVEPIHGFTVWTPGGESEYRATVTVAERGVLVLVQQDADEADSFEISDEAAVALYYALGSWMQRRGRGENGPLPVVPAPGGAK